jgi:hypothetical protein
VTDSAGPVVRSNRIRSPGEGISIWQSCGDYADNKIYAQKFGIQVTGGAATIRANQIGEGNSAGIWATDGFAGEIVDNDVWGPYPEAIITVQGSPDCRVSDNRGQSPLRQDALAVDPAGPGVGVSLPNPRMKDYGPLAELSYIWPNVFDSSKPLPQEILLIYKVARHGGVEVWLWEPMYRDDEFTYFDRLIARAVSQARDLQPDSIVNVRLSVGVDGLLRGQEVGIPGRPDRDLAIYPAPLSELWSDVGDGQQEPAEW